MLMTRRYVSTLFALVVAGASLGMTSALAAENDPKPFTEEAFQAAQKADKSILIETYATWCDICKRQMRILESLRGEARYKNLITFQVNFDTQKDVMRRFNARLQSTLICFHGTKEVGRSVGETQLEWVDDLLAKAVEKAPAS